jgi:(p)ppGpp synthase/HD superfamily hydrolase
VASYVSEWWDVPAQLVATVMNHMKHKENNNAKFENMNPHKNSDGDKVLLFVYDTCCQIFPGDHI